jgi:hypothetical protein
MKRYRLKKRESLNFLIGHGLTADNFTPKAGEVCINVGEMSRFDWLYGEELKGPADEPEVPSRVGHLVILHIPYPLPYINFRIPVPKNLVEEVPE